MTAENKLDTLIDRVSYKDEVPIDIDGVCNDEGILEQVLTQPIKLNPCVTHKIALVSMEGSAFFPNVNKSSNKFYYRNDSDRNIKSLTIPRCAYDIVDYNDRIKRLIELNGDNKNNITITLDKPTGKTEIELKGGYKVYFSEENVHTWRDCLGFESIDLVDDGVHTSKFVAEVLPAQKVYICCNICKGSLGNRDKKIRTNVLYSFPTGNKAYGAPFVLDPKILRPRELLMKEFDSILLQFIDDEGKPVHFNYQQITGELVIYQN